MLTYGEDAEGQSLTGYIKLWKLAGVREGYENLGKKCGKVSCSEEDFNRRNRPI